MTESVGAMFAAASAATSGPDTQNDMKMQRPPREALWAIFWAMGVCAAMLFIIVAIYAFGLWRGLWPDVDKAGLIKALLWIALGQSLCIAILVIALASSRLGTVKASTGAASLEIDGK